MKFVKHLMIVISLTFFCCNKHILMEEAVNIYKKIKKNYAPDKRVEIFDIKIITDGHKLILEGETTTKKALNIFIDSLKNKNINFVNDIRILPDSAVGDNKFALSNNSVINIRSKPKHSSELSTQALLGTVFKLIDKKGDFYRIQTPDKYISWVDKSEITIMNQSRIDAWNKAKKVIYTKNFGYVFSEENKNSAIVSDITLGCILVCIKESQKFYKVKYPDNRIGFIKKDEAKIYLNWLENLKATSQNIEFTANLFNGFPYLWGGTSPKGMDCSGFTKMVYLMNGLIIPRDASQQINAGLSIDNDLKFKGLEKGDLLFFGKKAIEGYKQKVTHVGIWLGNDKMEFIHASGNVHLSSMDESHPKYDDFNKRRYLGSRRYLGVKDKNIISLKEMVQKN